MGYGWLSYQVSLGLGYMLDGYEYGEESDGEECETLGDANLCM